METVIEQTNDETMDKRNYIIVYNAEEISLPKFYKEQDENGCNHGEIRYIWFITTKKNDAWDKIESVFMEEMYHATLNFKNKMANTEAIEIIKKIGTEVRIVEYNYLNEVVFDKMFHLNHISESIFNFYNKTTTPIIN